MDALRLHRDEIDTLLLSLWEYAEHPTRIQSVDAVTGCGSIVQQESCCRMPMWG
jgi:hypothetical protein